MYKKEGKPVQNYRSMPVIKSYWLLFQITDDLNKERWLTSWGLDHEKHGKLTKENKKKKQKTFSNENKRHF